MPTLEVEGYITRVDGEVIDVDVRTELAYYQDGPLTGELASGTLRPQNPREVDATFDRVDAIKLDDQFDVSAEQELQALARTEPAHPSVANP